MGKIVANSKDQNFFPLTPSSPWCVCSTLMLSLTWAVLELTWAKTSPYFFFFIMPGRVPLLWPCPMHWSHWKQSLVDTVGIWFIKLPSVHYVDCAFSVNLRILLNFIMWFTLKWHQHSIIFLLWFRRQWSRVSARPGVSGAEEGVSIKLFKFPDCI